jgi:tetratricopeptide (TPR) repeat protein
MAVPGLLIGLLLAVGATPTEPSSERALLDEAQSAFHEGNQAQDLAAKEAFRRAAECYEELHRRGVRSAALYRNQGNASLLAGDLPHAVLAYRRGLRLAPNDADLHANLAYARDQVVQGLSDHHGRPPVEQRPPWLPRLASKRVLGLVALLYALTWFTVTCWLMTRRTWLLAMAGGAFMVAVLLAVGFTVEAMAEKAEVHHPLVVIARAEGVKLRRGNGQSYPEYDYVLRPGVEGRLLFDDQRGWLQIELADGEVGWVRQADVLVDTP